MIKTLNSRLIAFSVAAVAVASIAAPAAAQSLDASTAVVVRVADLDTGHGPGQQVLQQRIRQAAIKACGPAPDGHLSAQRTAYETCRAQAVERAMIQADALVTGKTYGIASR